MEDALQRLMKESGSTKYASVATAAHKALGEKCDCVNPHRNCVTLCTVIMSYLIR